MSIWDDLPLCPANHLPLSPLRFLDRAARYYGARTALIHGDLHYSWAEVDARCRRLASALLAHGIGRGDTVSVLAPNGPAIFEAHFGVPMSGAVLNDINVRLDARSVAFILDHSESRALVVDSEFAALAKAALAETRRDILVVRVDDPLAGAAAGHIDGIGYEDFLAGGDPGFRSSEPASELQPITLNYTSGTTGNPKGVVYDHRNACLEAFGNLVTWTMPRHPVQLWVVPIFHANGWCYVWPLAGLGATNVMLRKPDGRSILAAIAEHGVTHICGAPIIAQLMAEVPEAERPRFSHPVKMLTAGSPPAPSQFRAMEAMGIELDQGYGLTEVFGPAVFCEPDPAWKDLPLAERARLKARQGLPNLVLDDLVVADPETLAPVPRDGRTMGEVLLRGNAVMRGYLKNPKATAEAFAGGWFHTGDLAVWHPDGFIELRDRSKDIIISGGENISSIEIEAAIADHPAVSTVAVIGAPDPKWGETPWAFIELREGMAAGEDEILALCRERLARFKVPRGITFTTIPKTSTGKVQKFELRKLLSENRP